MDRLDVALSFILGALFGWLLGYRTARVRSEKTYAKFANVIKENSRP
jgi:hypothetical protein